MSSDSKSAGNGIGLGTVLFIVFLVLKLCHVIAWSWWWVAAPVWIPVAILVFIAIVTGIGKVLL